MNIDITKMIQEGLIKKDLQDKLAKQEEELKATQEAEAKEKLLAERVKAIEKKLPDARSLIIDIYKELDYQLQGQYIFNGWVFHVEKKEEVDFEDDFHKGRELRIVTYARREKIFS